MHNFYLLRSPLVTDQHRCTQQKMEPKSDKSPGNSLETSVGQLETSKLKIGQRYSIVYCCDSKLDAALKLPKPVLPC